MQNIKKCWTWRISPINFILVWLSDCVEQDCLNTSLILRISVYLLSIIANSVCVPNFFTRLSKKRSRPLIYRLIFLEICKCNALICAKNNLHTLNKKIPTNWSRSWVLWVFHANLNCITRCLFQMLYAT